MDNLHCISMYFLCKGRLYLKSNTFALNFFESFNDKVNEANYGINVTSFHFHTIFNPIRSIGEWCGIQPSLSTVLYTLLRFSLIRKYSVMKI